MLLLSAKLLVSNVKKMKQNVIISHNLESELSMAVADCEHDRIFVLCDEVTKRLCFPLIKDFDCINNAKLITIKEGDVNKSLDAISHVWDELQKNGGTRHSLLINLGGGMVTDLGGFAASTFKRGINFINIPTTLLSMVDASVGGKTGINFGGLKNEIGVFSDSKYVILDTQFLATLDSENICSGYAEMLKHGLINNDTMWAELLNVDIQKPDLKLLQRLVAESVAVKERVVEIDPHEKGLRKALNLGHTAGHAFESMAMRKNAPILHGYAVAFGIVCELYLSAVKVGFPTDKMRQTVAFIKENYGTFDFTCDDYEELFSLMTHDKKNTAGIINFTLLANVGDIKINQTATKDEIFQALDFFREG